MFAGALEVQNVGMIDLLVACEEAATDYLILVALWYEEVLRHWQRRPLLLRQLVED